MEFNKAEKKELNDFSECNLLKEIIEQQEVLEDTYKKIFIQ